MDDVKSTMPLNVSEAEMQVLDALTKKKDFSKTAVLQQTLRLSQAVEARCRLVRNSSSRMRRPRKRVDGPMSQAQEVVAIADWATGNSIPAVLHIGLEDLEMINVEIVWSPERLHKLRELLQNGVPKSSLPQHVHWNWAMKAVKTSGDEFHYRSFGIEAAGQMQGLMLVCRYGKVARLDPDKGKPLVYVDFIETAPWNAKEFTSSPIYKGVGVRLIQAATRLSIDEEFVGRVGLHSLAQSKPFYTTACEMTALGPDSAYPGNLDYFELTAAQAVELLKK